LGSKLKDQEHEEQSVVSLLRLSVSFRSSGCMDLFKITMRFFDAPPIS
jgi:hypothetical protein